MKWQITTHEDIENAAKRPDVALVIIVGLKDLRSHIIWSTGAIQHFPSGSGVLHLGEAKVNDFELVVFIQHDVLGFDVSVSNSLGVHVANSSKKLLHVLLSTLFRQFLIVRTCDLFEQFTAIDIFHYKINLLLVLIRLIIFHDVGVIEFRKILHLLPDSLHLVVKVLSLKNFYGHLVSIIVYVLCQIDLAI